jgi:hypothetical protein
MTLSALQLIKIITLNDYDGLEKLIQSGKNINFNCDKNEKGQIKTLVSKAVEVRAKECFDLLIEIPNLTVLSCGTHLNGLAKAIEYYTGAPNTCNEHYLKKLLEKNAKYNIYDVCELIDFQEYFQLMFEKINKTKDNVKYLLEKAIESNKMGIINYLYDYLEQTYQPDELVELNKNIIKLVISYDNLGIFEYVKTKVPDFNVINNYPTILHCNKPNGLIFNYLYSQLESMNENQLNSIPFLSDLNHLYKTNPINLIKILELKLKFNDVTESMGDMILNNIRLIKAFNEKVNDVVFRLHLFAVYGYIKGNPLDYLTNEIEHFPIDDYKYSLRNSSYCNFIDLMRKIKWIGDNHGWKFSDKVIQLINTSEQKIYGSSEINQIEQEKLISDFNKQIDKIKDSFIPKNKSIKVTKPKKNKEFNI